MTAILGKLISLPALDLVWWRMVLVTGCLLVVPSVRRAVLRTPPRLVRSLSAVGVVVALHWLAFYSAIKLSNASVAATCLAFAPVFLALIEPLLVRRPFRAIDLLFGMAVIPGVALVVGGVPSRMQGGLVVGALAALLAAVFAVLNKRLIERAGPLTVTCIELGAGLALLTVVVLVRGLSRPALSAPIAVPGAKDALLLLLLALLCTLVPFALALVALRHLSAFGVQLTVNLEPVYAIAFAAIFLDERRELGTAFYAGVAVVLVLVFAYPYVARQADRASTSA